MTSPNFDPLYSTDNIWLKADEDTCLSDHLDNMESDIDSKAPASHTHSGYATADHTHTGYATSDHSHTGFAAESHGHSYNDLTDKPTIPSAYSHPASHPASMITGLAEVATSGSYSDLSNKPTIPTIPTSLPANGGNADTVDGKHATDFATASHTHNYASANHTHGADVITAHLEAVTYNAPVGGTWTNIPLTNLVLVGNSFALIDNQIRIGAGVSKVMVSAQICVGSASVEGNKYFAIRKNASQDKARTQMRLREAYTPETMCIPSLLIDVAEGDLLTIDYSGTQGDAIYGELIFTYLTVQKIA